MFMCLDKLENKSVSSIQTQEGSKKQSRGIVTGWQPFCHQQPGCHCLSLILYSVSSILTCNRWRAPLEVLLGSWAFSNELCVTPPSKRNCKWVGGPLSYELRALHCVRRQSFLIVDAFTVLCSKLPSLPDLLSLIELLPASWHWVLNWRVPEVQSTLVLNYLQKPWNFYYCNFQQ